ncbi:MAG: M28 family peptidase [Bdellovibrionales bacterium]|nr:M28 family peptidase [Bdellovibrionales bacterium]
MLKLITITIFSFALSAHGRAPSTYSQVRSELDKTGQKDIVNLVNEFVKAGAPSRMVSLPGHERAKNYILEKIKSYDSRGTGKLVVDTFSPDVDEAKRFYQSDFDQKVEGKVSQLHPDYQKWLKFTTYMKATAERYRSVQGVNIIWEKAGLDPSKILIITAHYDTISHDPTTLLIAEKSPMPGANYNASGVSVALGLVKTLALIDLNYTVQVVFLDYQGIAFLGSYRFATEAKKVGKTVMGFLNLEMLGQDTSFFDKTKKTGNMGVYFRPQDAKFIQSLTQHGSKITNKVIFEHKATGFENSDNIRLWDSGYTGGTFTQNWEDDFNPKFYQTPQDTPETLNHQTLFYSYQYIGGAVLGTLLDITK